MVSAVAFFYKEVCYEKECDKALEEAGYPLTLDQKLTSMIEQGNKNAKA